MVVQLESGYTHSFQWSVHELMTSVNSEYAVL